MSMWSRSLVALATGMALVSVTACSSGGATGDSSGDTSAETSKTSGGSSSQGLKQVKPCQILTSKDLATFGLEGPGAPYDGLPWAPGCEYDGKSFGLSVYTNFRETVESSSKKSSWAKFDKVKINDRKGAKAVNKGSTQAGICNVIFNAGQGMIKVQVGDPRDILDECAKGVEIAKQIEPRMPEPT